MHSRLSVTLAPIAALTGFSALTLQVVWQRVISLHSGVDLSSTTTVVAAFLGGLGVGSLLGGWLADRLGPQRSLLVFAIANAGIGLFAWISLLLFYDLYRELAPSLQSTFASFAFNVAILIVPTTLMGLSLPLIARAVTSRVSDAGPLVGRLYAINTIGAAAGSAVAGWYLLGTFGFENTVRFAGTLNLIAAGLIALVWRAIRNAGAALVEVPRDEAVIATPRLAETNGRVWPWFAIYGLTGAVALGFEQVFFRLIDAEMRSNSYSFAQVLTLYLVLFGTGAAIASRVVRSVRDPRRWFLALQFLVGVSALTALVGFVRVLPAIGFDDRLASYFIGDGYNGGFGDSNSWREWAKIGVIYFVVPLGLMGLPVLLMGASFPFVQRLVADRVDTLGRRTGLLLFVNICGNVAGTLIVGFVLLDALGTAGTYRLLAALLGVAGVAAVALAAGTRRRAAEGAVAVVSLGALLLASPSNLKLWAFLHGVPTDRVDVAEGRSCAAALRRTGQEAMLTVNGSTQNAHPFDDFHVLIGLVPAMAHPDPRNALAIGLGVGSTTYGMLQDPRLDAVTTVELCAGEYDLIDRLAAEGRPDFGRMFADPRYETRVGDGRKFLLGSDRRYDIITVDTLRPTAAFSGSLYSQEFYELVASRLNDDGIIAQWIPTGRVVNTVATVFPYVVAMSVPTYNQGAMFFVASRERMNLDPVVLEERFGKVPEEAFTAAQRDSLARFLREATRRCIADGARAELPSENINQDLRPRDEYFVNNDRLSPEVVSCE